MAKHISAFIFLLIFGGGLQGFGQIPPCFRDLETNFFTYQNTAQAFSMHNVSQNQWINIFNQLQGASQQIPDLVIQQARQMNPNPLEWQFQPAIAVILLKRALYSVFRQVMLQNYITIVTNEVAIRQMFEHIWSSQRLNMIRCLGEQALASEAITQ